MPKKLVTAVYIGRCSKLLCGEFGLTIIKGEPFHCTREQFDKLAGNGKYELIEDKSKAETIEGGEQ